MVELLKSSHFAWAKNWKQVMSIARWTHLSLTFDGNESRLFIDGVLSNSEVIGAINVHAGTNVISIGSENNNGSTTATPIAFSGTIGQVQVWTDVLTDQQVADNYNERATYFVDGIPEPTTSLLGVLGLMLLGLRRRR